MTLKNVVAMDKAVDLRREKFFLSDEFQILK